MTKKFMCKNCGEVWNLEMTAMNCCDDKAIPVTLNEQE